MSTARQVVDVLVKLRQAQGLSQARAAELRGVSQGSQADLERTTNPRIDTLISFADALGARMTVIVEAPGTTARHVDLYEDPRGRDSRWKAEGLVEGLVAVVGDPRPPASRALLVEVLDVLAQDDGRFFRLPEDCYPEGVESQPVDPGLSELCFLYAWHFMYEAKHVLADDAWKPLDVARGRSFAELQHPGLVEMLTGRDKERQALYALMEKATDVRNQRPIVEASRFHVL